MDRKLDQDTIVALAAAWEHEQSYANAIAETAQAIVLVMDREGRIARANQFLATLGGYDTPQDLIGKDWFSTFLPERDQDTIRELYTRALDGVRVDRYRNPVVDHAGREHQIEWSGKALPDAQGRVVGVLSVGIDISDSLQTHDQLEHQKELYETVLASTQDAFISIDSSGRVIYFNPGAERIFGYASEEIAGQKVNVLMPEPYRAEHDDYVRRYERTGVAKAIGRIRVVQGMRRNGEVFPIELSVCRSPAPANGVHYAAFIRDISEKVRTQERLGERERLAAIGVTSAKFAHEVANPLNGMSMNVQMAQRKVQKGAPSSALTPYLDRVSQQIRRLASLLDEFRGMSRRQSFQIQPTAPSALFDRIVQEHAEEYAGRGVTIQQDWPADLPEIMVDREKIVQVLLNLCKNAVEAMETGGTLSLTARLDDRQLHFCVADTGCGVPKDVDIYEPFATTKEDGTGLGLPVVRSIVLAHGGDLHHESGDGQGTTFIVSLPLDPPSQSSVNLLRLPPD